MKNGLLILTALSVLIPATAHAIDTGGKVSVKVQGRASFCAEEQGNGFKGEHLDVQLDGKVGKGLSYHLFHSLGKPKTSFMSATNWAYVQYDLGPWAFSMGKFMIEYGGMEYWAAPIDVYYAGYYWDHFNGCFNYGVTVSRALGENERLHLQVSRSPFSVELLSGMYAYSMSLRGRQGCWEHHLSVNLLEQTKGSFVNHVALGNDFTWGPVHLQVDLIHRSSLASMSFFKDFSTLGRLTVSATPWLDVFTKCCYDLNVDVDDLNVVPGTEMFKFGGGVEVYPIKDYRGLRIHCLYYKSGSVPAFMAGVTWKVYIFN